MLNSQINISVHQTVHKAAADTELYMGMFLRNLDTGHYLWKLNIGSDAGNTPTLVQRNSPFMYSGMCHINVVHKLIFLFTYLTLYALYVFEET